MRRAGLRAIALVGFLHLAFQPIQAHAQITAPREAAQIQLGPASLYPTLQLVDAGKDRNVFNDGQDEKEDYTFTVQSRLLAVVRLGLNELLFMSGSDYVWFQEYATERSTDAHYAVRFNLSASRLKPFFGAEHVRASSRPSREIDVRARRLGRAALAGLGVELTPRTSLTASVRVDQLSYEDGQAFRGVALDDSLSRTGRSANAGVRYAVTPLTTLVVLGGYEEQTFPDSHVRDARIYTLAPTVEFAPEAAIRGRATAGIEVFRPIGENLDEYVGSMYELALNWSLYGRTTFDLTGTRNVSYSYLDTEPYYLSTNVRLTVGQPLFGPLDVHGSYEWEQMSYRWRRGIAPSPGEVNRIDTLNVGSAGFGVHLGRGFRVRVGVERTRRRSIEDPRQNFERTRLLSAITIGS